MALSYFFNKTAKRAGVVFNKCSERPQALSLGAMRALSVFKEALSRSQGNGHAMALNPSARLPTRIHKVEKVEQIRPNRPRYETFCARTDKKPVTSTIHWPEFNGH